MGKKPASSKANNHGVTVQIAMIMMMLQQNQDHTKDCQRRIEREEVAKLECEERMEMFWLTLQQQAMAQQANQQMMTMMMMKMTGSMMGNNKWHNTGEGNGQYPSKKVRSDVNNDSEGVMTKNNHVGKYDKNKNEDRDSNKWNKILNKISNISLI